MKTSAKTTEEILTEAFIRHGCKPTRVGYTPPKRKAKAGPAKAVKHGGNGRKA